ncbi:MAG: hypothetical protein M1812_000789 [Candelaria pacifica]|nr:MAG: hypothetical protein M1812_000789 [Candelaria pacifica]
MSMRIVPSSSHPTSHTNTTNSNFSKGAPSAPGIHDTLRANTASLSNASSSTQTSIESAHPLEARLAKWQSTQEALKMEGLRRTFGIAEPIRRGMELKICEAGEWRPAVLGGAVGGGVHCDVLRGREAECGWEDVFVGDALRDQPDFHTEMEARGKMNW